MKHPLVVFAQTIDKFYDQVAQMPVEHLFVVTCSAFIAAIYLAGAFGWFDEEE